MSGITSRPYHPDPQMACERCVWGRGEHAEWCDNYKIQVYLRKWISAAMQEFSDYLQPLVGVRYAPGAPNDSVYFVGHPELHETTEEWAKRCAVITDVGGTR